MKLAPTLAYGRVRLARVSILISSSVLACEGGGPVDSDPNPVEFTISPKTATLQLGEPREFTAVGIRSNGDTAQISVTWGATSGTILDTSSLGGRHYGRYQKATCGNALVFASSDPGRMADTATVSVLCVASLSVSPALASVPVGATVQLSAILKDANGTPVTGRTVTWVSDAASTATVNSSGRVSGVAAGGATITATSEGQSGRSAVTVTAVPPPPPPSGSGVTFVGAGDIASCSSSGDEATAQLLDNIPGTVFTLGDNAYSNGSAAEFTNCYAPAWGRHLARTRPSPGNHDYHTSGAAAYYAYYGANAGPAGRGYYSYDLGDWHLISLNSNISMSAGSAQEQWLRADLATASAKCVLAYWHHPRFSSSTHHGNNTSTQPLWQALYDAGADVALSGHDHDYERFAPQTPSGAADPVRGIREFVVGTGGVSHYTGAETPREPNSEVFDGSSFGVLKLTLGAGSYSWQFIPTPGGSFTDAGTGQCH